MAHQWNLCGGFNSRGSVYCFKARTLPPPSDGPSQGTHSADTYGALALDSSFKSLASLAEQLKKGRRVTCSVTVEIAFPTTQGGEPLSQAMAFAPVPESITTKVEYETSLGKLKFHDGLPDEATVKLVYDNLDRSRAMHAFLDLIPMASMEAMRIGHAAIGCDACHKASIYGSLMDAKSLWLTGNTDTVYIAAMLDLERDGPTVIDVPAGAGPGLLNDAYFRYVTDMGKPGPDKGAGGKYLILPPGHSKEVPSGYHIARSPTYTNWVVLRGFLQDGRPDAAATMWREQLKIYPLSTSLKPPKMEFFDMSGKDMNTIHSNDFHFFQEINQVIQKEPVEFLDPELRGNLSAIGIRTG